MNFSISTPESKEVEKWVGILAAVVFTAFRKEILDGLKAGYKSSHKWLRNWSQRRNFVVQLTEQQWEAARKESLVGLEASLYMLLEEYKADRISVMEYEATEDGGGLATCLVEALRAEMPSVWGFQKKPINTELMHEIQGIVSQPRRLRYVSDARHEDVAALRAAMLNAGAYSAYYQVISQPTQKPLRMLAVSWQQPHELTAEYLNMLRWSGIMCSNTLSDMDKLRKTSDA